VSVNGCLRPGCSRISGAASQVPDSVGRDLAQEPHPLPVCPGTTAPVAAV